MDLGRAVGHRSLVIGSSFTNQRTAQFELFSNAEKRGERIFAPRKGLDAEVVRLHLGTWWAKFATMGKQQAEYIGVPMEGPCRPDRYRS